MAFDLGKILDRSSIGITAAAVVWMFSTFASAADLKRMEVRQVRSEIRSLCVKYVTAPESAKPMIAEFIKKSKDELCFLHGDDARCSKSTVEEICAE